jgi:superfamily II DNA or RNA helicase
MQQGIYESLISKLVQSKLDELDREVFYVDQKPIDKTEAKDVLSQYFSLILKRAISYFTGEEALVKQITLINKLIFLIKDELDEEDFEKDLLAVNTNFLTAIFSKIDLGASDFQSFLKSITPESRLIFSSLITGGGGAKKLQMDGELQKEISSADRIDFLVSFIKWEGLRLLMQQLQEFTKRGGKLRLITTTYVGATDAKSVEFLAKLPNTEVKVSYNTKNERVHVKAYLFYRNTGFNTAYIGSSNLSKSALTKGLEWNVKLNNTEIPHVIETAQHTFDTYWNSKDFETYDPDRHLEKLRRALQEGRFGSGEGNELNLGYFDIKPYTFQEEILEKLEVERMVHGRYRNLLVAATGTGKTLISAFDFHRFYKKNPAAKLLFVAHRKEILQQSIGAFRGVLKDNNFGELWVDGEEPNRYEHLFASVQTLNNRLESLNLSSGYFDFIIVDEVHHISADSYRPILHRFTPKILLGLTATPERMDGADILADFCDHIAAEIRLPEALNQKLLCPFNYFGIADSIDISQVSWSRGRYMPSELSNLYTSNDQRVANIISSLDKYVTDIADVRALGFCVTQEHAQYMTEKFHFAGLKADYLVSGRNENRKEIRNKLRKKEINYLFVVDIFNEGVDIPEIDTVLFLRPTESLTVFLQQLGRGLRLADGKDCLTVLDFVGNARSEYDFEGKFRAMIGKTNTSIASELERNFQHVPLGCAIILEKQAREIILNNIRASISPNRNQLIQKIRNFQHQSDLPLTLRNFITLYHFPLEIIYKRGSWNRLTYEAGVSKEPDSTNERAWESCVGKKWLSTESYSYFSFVLGLAKKGFQVELDSMTPNEKSMCLMLHYDFWQNAGGFPTLETSINAIGRNQELVKEMIQVLEIRMDQIGFMELEIDLPYDQPLKLHSRYTRDQILAAFGFSSFESKSSNREGVAERSEINTELLFIDLNKSDEHYSPTTMYEDYALNETLFHWQSQNSARPDIGKGLSYIKHQTTGKKILLFVREEKQNQYKNTMGYVFIGEGKLKDYYGSKPMSINWELNEPIPPFLYQASAKLSLG